MKKIVTPTIKVDSDNVYRRQIIFKKGLEKQTTTFYGINHAYAFDCINCDSIIIATLLGYGETFF